MRTLKLLVVLFVLTLWSSPALASSVSKDVVGSGNWTEALSVEKGSSVNVSIGSYNATTSLTITLQRKLPGDSAWGRDVDTWAITGSSADKEYITKPEVENDTLYRIGCETTYTSGNCTVRLGGGRK